MILQTTTNLYLLNNQDNYKKSIDSSLGEVVDKYMLLLIEYIHFIMEYMHNSVTMKNSTFNKFIIQKGIDTITHVFTLLLYYSRNLELSYYHSQKAFYLYVEFISQVSNEQNSFLHLTSRDAVLFVYKKTIFDIHNDIQKYDSQLLKPDAEKLKVLDCIINIFKHIVYFTLDAKDVTLFEKDNKFIVGNLKTTLESICTKLLKYTFTHQEYKVIELFVSYMQLDNMNMNMNMNMNINSSLTTDKYYEIIDVFIQKYSKLKPDMLEKVNICKIKEKFMDADCAIEINESTDKFIKWILK